MHKKIYLAFLSPVHKVFGIILCGQYVETRFIQVMRSLGLCNCKDRLFLLYVVIPLFFNLL